MRVVHDGGPAAGVTVDGPSPPPGARYWAPAAARRARAWVAMARYVLEPVTDLTPVRRYTYTGEHQDQGPVPATKVYGTPIHPDWSW